MNVWNDAGGASRSLKVWIAALALLSLVAGGVFGHFADRWFSGQFDGPKPSYTERLSLELGLSTDQRRELHDVLDWLDREMHAATSKFEQEIQPQKSALRSELDRLGREADQKIEELLDEEQLAVFRNK